MLGRHGSAGLLRIHHASIKRAPRSTAACAVMSRPPGFAPTRSLPSSLPPSLRGFGRAGARAFAHALGVTISISLSTARSLSVATSISLLASVTFLAAPGRAEEAHPCAAGEVLATGRPDATIIAWEASPGVRAFWCETYDEQGNALRGGPYWDLHADGSPRIRARYVESRLEGAVEIFAEDGTLWLRGSLSQGEWSGPVEIFHADGERWFAARFEGGRLAGPVETAAPAERAGAAAFHPDARDPPTVEGRPSPTPAENAEREGRPMARIDARGPAAALSAAGQASAAPSASPAAAGDPPGPGGPTD